MERSQAVIAAAMLGGCSVVQSFPEWMRGTGDTVATLLGISRATLYRRLDALHAAMLDQLHEIELDRQEAANAIRRAQARPAAGCGVGV